MQRDVLAHGLKMVTVIKPVITQHVIGMEAIALVRQQCEFRKSELFVFPYKNNYVICLFHGTTEFAFLSNKETS